MSEEKLSEKWKKWWLDLNFPEKLNKTKNKFWELLTEVKILEDDVIRQKGLVDYYCSRFSQTQYDRAEKAEKKLIEQQSVVDEQKSLIKKLQSPINDAERFLDACTINDEKYKMKIVIMSLKDYNIFRSILRGKNV